MTVLGAQVLAALVLQCSGELRFDRYSPEKSGSELNLRTAVRLVRSATPCEDSSVYVSMESGTQFAKSAAPRGPWSYYHEHYTKSRLGAIHVQDLKLGQDAYLDGCCSLHLCS